MPPPTPLSVVMGDGGDILNLPNLHLWVSKSSECWLGTWSKGLGPVSSCGPEFDILGSSLHLWAPVFWAAAFWAANIATFGLISVSLSFSFHSHSSDGFLDRKMGCMDKGVSEGYKAVADAKCILSFSHWRSEADDLLIHLLLPPSVISDVSCRLLHRKRLIF